MAYYKTPIDFPNGLISQDTAKINENFTELAKSFVNNDPTTYTVVNAVNATNANKINGFTTSITPSPNTIPVAGSTGKIDINWISQGSGSNLNADKVDGYHASQTPAPNTIPVADVDGKLNLGWLNASQTPAPNTIPVADANGKLNAWVDVFSSSRSETYSRLLVATSFPTSPNHNDLCWRSDELKLYRYNVVSGTWSEVDWKSIVKASPEWIAGRLRINGTTGKLEISPDGSNWYECIPAVGSNSIELVTLDNTNYSYKYWIAPSQTAIIKNANHVPIVYTPVIEPFFEGRYWHSYSFENWVGLRPSNVAINNGDGQYGSGQDFSVIVGRNTSLSIVPILEQSATSENWANFVLRIKSNQRWLINSIGQGSLGYEVIVCNGSGTASTTSYWLGTWYDQNGGKFTVAVVVLTRTA